MEIIISSAALRPAEVLTAPGFPGTPQLKLYSRTADAFTGKDENTGVLFASHAAVALVGAQHEHHLLTALAGRDIIGQANNTGTNSVT